MPVKGNVRTALAAAALATALVFTAGACGDDGKSDGGLAPSQEDKKDKDGDLKLPEGLPTSLEDLEKWKNGGWEDWVDEEWLREAEDFVNPIIEDLWDASRMREAEEPEQDVPSDVSGDDGVTDPEPQPVEAERIASPYTESAPPVGKVFFDGPEGPMVCSATVVEDPANPGKSNLVATAGHCVHKGAKGGWYRNVMFVPSYNEEGKSAAELEAEQATAEDVSPRGVWWADKARTTDEWIAEGQSEGGKGAPYDFAVLHVQPREGGGKSLQETTGSAVPVAFDAPKVSETGTTTAMGYPAAKPFDGEQAYSCQDEPGRLSIEAGQPTMYRIGCTMTAGSSGGGWFTESGGKQQLVSVTSIGPANHIWLAGPHLGKEAQGVFSEVSGG